MVLVITAASAPISVPDYPIDARLIKCPNNTHIWAESELECKTINPFGGFGGTTRGGGGSGGGLLGLIRDVLGGIF